jgi:PBSX family phage terminase large subunit
MPPNGTKNLKPQNTRTKEKQKEIAKMGGIASGVARRRKKEFAETLNKLLDVEVKSASLKKNLEAMGVDTNDKKDKPTMQTAMLAGMVASATKGNVGAYLAIKDTLEEANETLNADEYPPVKIPAELIVGAYANLNRHISNGTTREAIIKGGRGGWKSSYPGLKIPELIMANPSMHALCLRNVKDTLKDSVFEQLKWGIDKLGVSDRFKFTTSPLKITYKPTGQTIYFRGADDPIKIKSIKPPFGYIGIVWFEEFDQYAGEAAIRNMRQSAIRGTDENGESRAIIFETFNPPKTAQAWANQYVADIEGRANDPEKAKKGTEILHTCYTDVPREWLGLEFIQEAEDLKRNNPKAYENEYEGKVTGTGGNVFENLEIRDITDEEVKNFDKAKQGLDWGYFPDPTAFVKLQYDPAKMIIYVFDEKKRLKTGNEELIDILKEYKHTQTIADNAEEKSIAFFRSNGYNIRACVKGPGSVDFGIKWLASRAKIVIDRKRCPEAAKEFEMYEYMKDKDGNFISGYPDENNHFIDAVRYALNDEIMRSKTAFKNVRY